MISQRGSQVSERERVEVITAQPPTPRGRRGDLRWPIRISARWPALAVPGLIVVIGVTRVFGVPGRVCVFAVAWGQ